MNLQEASATSGLKAGVPGPLNQRHRWCAMRTLRMLLLRESSKSYHCSYLYTQIYIRTGTRYALSTIGEDYVCHAMIIGFGFCVWEADEWFH